jgi:cyclase
MLQKRIIPCLILHDEKCIHIKNFDENSKRYVGDPINIINIFNDYEVDELVILDKYASIQKKINFEFLELLSQEAFFPLSYGGGINNKDDAKKLINIGFEKIIINNYFLKNKNILSECSKAIGSQSVILSLNISYQNGNYYIFDHLEKKLTNINFNDLIEYINITDVGELFLCDVDRDGLMNGYNRDLVKNLTNKFKIPLIYKGGLKSYDELTDVLKNKIDAVASSTLFIMKKKDGGIVLNYPSEIFKKNL